MPENETKTKWPRDNTGLLWVSSRQGAMSQSDWCEAKRGSRSVDLGTTVVTLLPWANSDHAPGLCGPFIRMLLQPHPWAGSLLSAAPLKWNLQVDFCYSPDVTLKNLKFSCVYTYPHSRVQPQPQHSPPPSHMVVPFLFKPGLSFSDWELVVVREWVFISLVPSSELAF